MKRCSGCRWTRYCNRDCQKADWRTHRTVCCPDHSLARHQRQLHLPEGVCSFPGAVRSGISASSSSSGILTEAENAEFRSEFDESISRGEISWQLDQVLARYPPSDTAEVHPPRDDEVFCSLCTMWLRDEPQYDAHLIGKKHRKNIKRAAAANAGRVEE